MSTPSDSRNGSRRGSVDPNSNSLLERSKSGSASSTKPFDKILCRISPLFTFQHFFSFRLLLKWDSTRRPSNGSYHGTPWRDHLECRPSTSGAIPRYRRAKFIHFNSNSYTFERYYYVIVIRYFIPHQRAREKQAFNLVNCHQFSI